jgi:hypothetical protein
MRPSWQCLACGEDWPCPPRRSELRAGSPRGRVSLALFMAQYFQEALDDHPHTPAGDVYARFLGWVRGA